MIENFEVEINQADQEQNSNLSKMKLNLNLLMKNQINSSAINNAPQTNNISNHANNNINHNNNFSQTYNGVFRDEYENSRRDQNNSTIIGRKIDNNGVIVQNSGACNTTKNKQKTLNSKLIQSFLFFILTLFTKEQFPMHLEIIKNKRQGNDSVSKSRYIQQNIIDTQNLIPVMDLSIEAYSLKAAKSTQVRPVSVKSSANDQRSQKVPNTAKQRRGKNSNSRENILPQNAHINQTFEHVSNLNQSAIDNNNFFRSFENSSHPSKIKSSNSRNLDIEGEDSGKKQTITISECGTSEIEGDSRVLLQAQNPLNNQFNHLQDIIEKQKHGNNQINSSVMTHNSQSFSFGGTANNIPSNNNSMINNSNNYINGAANSNPNTNNGVNVSMNSHNRSTLGKNSVFSNHLQSGISLNNNSNRQKSPSSSTGGGTGSRVTSAMQNIIGYNNIGGNISNHYAQKQSDNHKMSKSQSKSKSRSKSKNQFNGKKLNNQSFNVENQQFSNQSNISESNRQDKVKSPTLRGETDSQSIYQRKQSSVQPNYYMISPPSPSLNPIPQYVSKHAHRIDKIKQIQEPQFQIIEVQEKRRQIVQYQQHQNQPIQRPMCPQQLNYRKLDNEQSQKTLNLIKQQQQDQEKQKKLEKQNELAQQNVEIRTKNAQYVKNKENEDIQYPWGFNQQKLNNQNVNRSEMNELTRVHRESSKKEEKVRREELGLSFLNELDESELQIIRKKIKEKESNGDTGVNLSDQQQINFADDEEHQVVQQFMVYKQKRDEEMRLRKKQQDYEQRQQVKQNLMKLEDLVKNKMKDSMRETRSRSLSRQKTKIKERSISGDLYNHSHVNRILPIHSNIPLNGNFTNNIHSNPLTGPNTQDLRQIYSSNAEFEDLLYEEYRKMLEKTSKLNQPSHLIPQNSENQINQPQHTSSSPGSSHNSRGKISNQKKSRENDTKFLFESTGSSASQPGQSKRNQKLGGGGGQISNKGQNSSSSHHSDVHFKSKMSQNQNSSTAWNANISQQNMYSLKDMSQEQYIPQNQPQQQHSSNSQLNEDDHSSRTHDEIEEKKKQIFKQFSQISQRFSQWQSMAAGTSALGPENSSMNGSQIASEKSMITDTKRSALTHTGAQAPVPGLGDYKKNGNQNNHLRVDTENDKVDEDELIMNQFDTSDFSQNHGAINLVINNHIAHNQSDAQNLDSFSDTMRTNNQIVSGKLNFQKDPLQIQLGTGPIQHNESRDHSSRPLTFDEEEVKDLEEIRKIELEAARIKLQNSSPQMNQRNNKFGIRSQSSDKNGKFKKSLNEDGSAFKNIKYDFDDDNQYDEKFKAFTLFNQNLKQKENLRIEGDSNNEFGDEDFDDEDYQDLDEYSEQFEKSSIAATIIQQIWRGHQTRKILGLYLEMFKGEQQSDRYKNSIQQGHEPDQESQQQFIEYDEGTQPEIQSDSQNRDQQNVISSNKQKFREEDQEEDDQEIEINSNQEYQVRDDDNDYDDQEEDEDDYLNRAHTGSIERELLVQSSQNGQLEEKDGEIDSKNGNQSLQAKKWQGNIQIRNELEDQYHQNKSNNKQFIDSQIQPAPQQRSPEISEYEDGDIEGEDQGEEEHEDEDEDYDEYPNEMENQYDEDEEFQGDKPDGYYQDLENEVNALVGQIINENLDPSELQFGPPEIAQMINEKLIQAYQQIHPDLFIEFEKEQSREKILRKQNKIQNVNIKKPGHFEIPGTQKSDLESSVIEQEEEFSDSGAVNTTVKNDRSQFNNINLNKAGNKSQVPVNGTLPQEEQYSLDDQGYYDGQESIEEVKKFVPAVEKINQLEDKIDREQEIAQLKAINEVHAQRKNQIRHNILCRSKSAQNVNTEEDENFQRPDNFMYPNELNKQFQQMKNKKQNNSQNQLQIPKRTSPKRQNFIEQEDNGDYEYEQGEEGNDENLLEINQIKNLPGIRNPHFNMNLFFQNQEGEVELSLQQEQYNDRNFSGSQSQENRSRFQKENYNNSSKKYLEYMENMQNDQNIIQRRQLYQHESGGTRDGDGELKSSELSPFITDKILNKNESREVETHQFETNNLNDQRPPKFSGKNNLQLNVLDLENVNRSLEFLQESEELNKQISNLGQSKHLKKNTMSKPNPSVTKAGGNYSGDFSQSEGGAGENDHRSGVKSSANQNQLTDNQRFGTHHNNDTLVMNQIFGDSQSLVTVKDFETDYENQSNRQKSNQKGIYPNTGSKNTNSVEFMRDRYDEQQDNVMEQKGGNTSARNRARELENSKSYQNDNSMDQPNSSDKNFDKTNEELLKFQQEQVKKWNEMALLLGNLTANQNLSDQAKTLLNMLVNQSQNNQQSLNQIVLESGVKASENSYSQIFQEAVSDFIDPIASSDVQQNTAKNSVVLNENKPEESKNILVNNFLQQKQVSLGGGASNQGAGAVFDENKRKRAGLQQNLMIDISLIQQDQTIEQEAGEEEKIQAQDQEEQDSFKQNEDILLKSKINPTNTTISETGSNLIEQIKYNQPIHVANHQHDDQLNHISNTEQKRVFQRNIHQKSNINLIDETALSPQNNQQQDFGRRGGIPPNHFRGNNNNFYEYQGDEDLNDEDVDHQEDEEEDDDGEDEGFEEEISQEYLKEREIQVKHSLDIQISYLNQIFSSGQISPRSYKQKQTEIESMVKGDLQEIKKIREFKALQVEQMQQMMSHQQKHGQIENQSQLIRSAEKDLQDLEEFISKEQTNFDNQIGKSHKNNQEKLSELQSELIFGGKQNQQDYIEQEPIYPNGSLNSQGQTNQKNFTSLLSEMDNNTNIPNILNSKANGDNKSKKVNPEGYDKKLQDFLNDSQISETDLKQEITPPQSIPKQVQKAKFQAVLDLASPYDPTPIDPYKPTKISVNNRYNNTNSNAEHVNNQNQAPHSNSGGGFQTDSAVSHDRDVLSMSQPENDYIQRSAGVVINEMDDEMYEDIRQFEQSVGSDFQLDSRVFPKTGEENQQKAARQGQHPPNIDGGNFNNVFNEMNTINSENNCSSSAEKEAIKNHIKVINEQDGDVYDQKVDDNMSEDDNEDRDDEDEEDEEVDQYEGVLKVGRKIDQTNSDLSPGSKAMAGKNRAIQQNPKSKRYFEGAIQIESQEENPYESEDVLDQLFIDQMPLQVQKKNFDFKTQIKHNPPANSPQFPVSTPIKTDEELGIHQGSSNIQNAHNFNLLQLSESQQNLLKTPTPFFQEDEMKLQKGQTQSGGESIHGNNVSDLNYSDVSQNFSFDASQSQNSKKNPQIKEIIGQKLVLEMAGEEIKSYDKSLNHSNTNSASDISNLAVVTRPNQHSKESDQKKDQEILVEDELILSDGYQMQQKAGVITEYLFHFLLEDIATEFFHSQQISQSLKILKHVDHSPLFSPNSPRDSQISSQRKEQDKPQKLKGIRTSMAYVKDYLHRLRNYVEKLHREDFIRHLNIELGPKPIEMLRFLHTDIQFQSSTDSIFQHQAIINTDIYQEIENIILQEQKLDVNNHIPHNEFTKELQHIHNQVIFDAMNESLDWFRIYGLSGRPFPWKIDAKSLQQKKVYPDQFEKIIKKSIDKVIQWATCLCGIMFDQEDSPIGLGVNLDEQYINQIQQDRLARMLASQVVQAQDRWIIYDDEQTQVGVQLGDLVFDKLLNQLIEEMIVKDFSLVRNRKL